MSSSTTPPVYIQHDEALSTVWTAMNMIAPLFLAESSWDNVGILLQAPSPELNKGKKIMLAIDLTTDVCDEVLQDGHIAVLVVYHPIIFRALKSITLQNSQQRSLLRLAAANISIYTPHTSLDACQNGINDWLITICTVPGLHQIATPIQASKSPPEGQKESGMGRIVVMERNSVSLSGMVHRIKENAGLKYVQVACPSNIDANEKSITSIAVCAGSGSGVLMGVKADLYVTGEMSHHEVLACVAQGIAVILTNHSNSERGFLKAALAPGLKRAMESIGKTDYSVVVSSKDRDPLETW